MLTHRAMCLGRFACVHAAATPACNGAAMTPPPRPIVQWVARIESRSPRMWCRRFARWRVARGTTVISPGLPRCATCWTR